MLSSRPNSTIKGANMNTNTKQLTIIAMLSAMAFVARLMIRVPMFLPFLSYEPKDVVIIIGGFLFGPVVAIFTIVIVCFVQMITISDSGPIGMVMNIVSSFSFVIPAVLIYRHRRSLSGAVIGLVAGVLIGTAVMLLWNYLIVPLYTPHVSRAAVVSMLMPVFLPFNLVKHSLNAALVMLLYKPISMSLTRAGLYQPSASGGGKLNLMALVISAFAVLTLILIILAERGVF